MNLSSPLCVHLRERKLSHKFLAKEDHACDPEEEDVVARLQERARIKHFQVLGL